MALNPDNYWQQGMAGALYQQREQEYQRRLYEELMARQGMQAYHEVGTKWPEGVPADPVLAAPVRDEKRYKQLLLLCKSNHTKS